jgi:hypothetical protein
VPKGDSAKAETEAGRNWAAEDPLALKLRATVAPLAAANEPGKLGEQDEAGDERASTSARSWLSAANKLRVAALLLLLPPIPPLPLAPLILTLEPEPARAAVNADAVARCGESVSASAAPPTRRPPPPPEIGRKLCGLPSNSEDALPLPLLPQYGDCAGERCASDERGRTFRAESEPSNSPPNSSLSSSSPPPTRPLARSLAPPLDLLLSLPVKSVSDSTWSSMRWTDAMAALVACRVAGYRSALLLPSTADAHEGEPDEEAEAEKEEEAEEEEEEEEEEEHVGER